MPQPLMKLIARPVLTARSGKCRQDTVQARYAQATAKLMERFDGRNTLQSSLCRAVNSISYALAEPTERGRQTYECWR